MLVKPEVDSEPGSWPTVINNFLKCIRMTIEPSRWRIPLKKYVTTMQAIVVAQQDSNMQLYNVSLINYTTVMNQ